MTVSYTHLDVYKRQALPIGAPAKMVRAHCSTILWGRRATISRGATFPRSREPRDYHHTCISGKSPRPRSGTVSYTHLDVYKRQVALGVIYDHPRPTFERAVVAQNAEAAKGKTPDLQKLVSKGQTWQVEKEPHVI